MVVSRSSSRVAPLTHRARWLRSISRRWPSPALRGSFRVRLRVRRQHDDCNPPTVTRLRGAPRGSKLRLPEAYCKFPPASAWARHTADSLSHGPSRGPRVLSGRLVGRLQHLGSGQRRQPRLQAAAAIHSCLGLCSESVGSCWTDSEEPPGLQKLRGASEGPCPPGGSRQGCGRRFQLNNWAMVMLCTCLVIIR